MPGLKRHQRLKWRRVLMGAFACLVFFPGAAAAQMPDREIDAARNVLINDFRPTALYSIEQNPSEPGTGAWSLTAIYAQPRRDQTSPDSARRPYWIARRIEGVGDAPSVAVTWADSRTCPALEGAIWWMSRLIVPSIDVMGISPPPPRAGGPPTVMTLHAPLYTIWGRGTQPDALPAEVTVSAYWGLIADWGQTTERNLRDCWTPDEPAPPEWQG